MICHNCQKEYEPPQKRGRKSRFCCRACADEWKRNQAKKFNRVCEYCGRTFSTNSHKQKYCSKECSQAARRTGRTIYTKKCLYCGVEFQTIYKTHKYCTSACAARHAGDQRKGKYFCEYCGKPRWSDHPNRNRFCSRECANKAKHIETFIRNEEKQREKEQKRLELLKPRECDYCRTVFIPTHINHRFCSSECNYTWKLEEARHKNREGFIPKAVRCSNCGVLFMTTLWAQDKQYCSDLCRVKAAHKRGKDIRREQMKTAFVEPVGLKTTFKHYGGTCAICGLPVPETTEPSNQWAATVDHIVPLSKGGLHEKYNCQLAHRLCNSIKLDTEDQYQIDWAQKLRSEPGRWNSQLDDLWNQLGIELPASG